MTSVAEHFSAEASHWADLYDLEDVTSRIYQQRLDITMGWIDRLHLPAARRALDLGAGAGQASLALARRGFEVEAIDVSDAMVERIRAGARGERVHAQTGDASALPFPDHHFDLVVALGLLPWVPSPLAVLREIARVVRPNGHVIVSTANRARLTYRLDPLYNQDLAALKRPVRAWLERTGRWRASGPEPTLITLDESSRLLREAGITPVSNACFGFGPFTFMGRRVCSDGFSVALDKCLQRYVWLRNSGSEHLLLGHTSGDKTACDHICSCMSSLPRQFF